MGKESYIAPRKSKSGDGFWSISRENMIPTLNEDGMVVVAVTWLSWTEEERETGSKRRRRKRQVQVK
jgi:hypothetical protein